jgi:hypothetical protein
MENLLISMISPLKIELFHPIRIPLEFQIEGEKAYLLKRLGASFYEGVVKMISLSFLKTEDYTRAFINFFSFIALHLSSKLIPLMFQLRMFQLLFRLEFELLIFVVLSMKTRLSEGTIS